MTLTITPDMIRTIVSRDLIESRADKLPFPNQIQRERYVERQAVLSRAPEADA